MCVCASPLLPSCLKFRAEVNLPQPLHHTRHPPPPLPPPALQANNAVVREWGERRQEEKLYNHVDLVQLLDIVDMDAGTQVAGGRGYYLMREGVLFNQVCGCGRM